MWMGPGEAGPGPVWEHSKSAEAVVSNFREAEIPPLCPGLVTLGGAWGYMQWGRWPGETPEGVGRVIFKPWG